LHAGIALSASLATILGTLGLIGLLARRLPNISARDLTMYLARCGAIALIGALVAFLVFDGLHVGVVTWTGRIAGVLCAALGGAIYFGIALALRVPESQMLLNWALGFLCRREASG